MSMIVSRHNMFDIWTLSDIHRTHRHLRDWSLITGREGGGAQGSDSGPFGTGCVNMIISNDPF